MALGLSGSASADLVAWAATAQGNFGQLDLDTGVYTNTGSSSSTFADGGSAIFGMGYIGGTLYGVDNNASSAGFYSISTPSGALSLIASLPVNAIGGTSALGDFYGVTQDPTSASLFAVDTSGSLLGTLPLGFPGDGLVALGSAGPTLYVASFTGSGSDELYSIALGGAVTDIGSLGQQAFTGIVSGDTLYTTDGENIYTYMVTPTSVSGLLGSVGVTGLIGGDQISALAVNPTPEPSTFAIVGIAIAAAGFVHARRRRLVG